MLAWIIACSVTVVFLYKLIDFLIRIPSLGNYGDRYILITGCDTGFGNLLAQRLDGLGCHVFAGCLTEKGAADLKEVTSERLCALLLDVTNGESVRNCLTLVKSKLPSERGLWGVVNNAGGARNATGQPDWMRLENYRAQCDLNLFGLIDVTLAFLPLVKKEKGRVVNMSSIYGRFTFTICSPYSIAKHGVEAFSDAIRRSLRSFGCQVSIIEPGIHLHQTADAMNDRLSQLIRQTFERADPGIQEDYGHSYASSGKGLRFFLSQGSRRVGDVIDAYEHALFGRNPRARYVVGWDARFIYLPLQWLPEWLGDWIYERLEHRRPRPSSTR